MVLPSAAGHAVPLPEQLLPGSVGGTVESSTILEMSPGYESHKNSKQKKESLLEQRKHNFTGGIHQALGLRKEMHLGTEQLQESQLAHASLCFIFCSCSVHMLESSLP